MPERSSRRIKDKETKKLYLPSPDKYRTRKIIFWSSLGAIFLGAVFFIFILPGINWSRSDNEIRTGICGAIRQPAVYTMIEGSDLSMLIRRAGGLTPNADISRINLDRVLRNDTIYPIPSRLRPQADRELEDGLAEALTPDFEDIARRIAADMDQPPLKQINFLYIGFPAVYIIINYYPELNLMQMNHIPHTTLFLNNDFRLIDLFFMKGIDYTVRLIEIKMQTRIHHYVMQDRNSFIKMIDLLKGIEINIDLPFAEEYELKAGVGKLDGFLTWEFIRFLDIRRMQRTVNRNRNIDLSTTDNFTIPPAQLQLAYEMRNHRQKLVLNAMRQTFGRLSTVDQSRVVINITSTFETDLGPQQVLDLYKGVTGNIEYNFSTIPGFYSEENNNLYFYPDARAFELLKRQELEKYFKVRSARGTTIY
jgi:hypothetical protein